MIQTPHRAGSGPGLAPVAAGLAWCQEDHPSLQGFCSCLRTTEPWTSHNLGIKTKVYLYVFGGLLVAWFCIRYESKGTSSLAKLPLF